MEIPVVCGEGGSHMPRCIYTFSVIHCESADGVSEHAVSCEQVSYKMTLCLLMSEIWHFFSLTSYWESHSHSTPGALFNQFQRRANVKCLT